MRRIGGAGGIRRLHGHMDHKPAEADRIAARIAARQHGARGFRTARISDDELTYEPAAAALSLHALLRSH
jgi:hypothetical protein